jgi:hypothetical protein
MAFRRMYSRVARKVKSPTAHDFSCFNPTVLFIHERSRMSTTFSHSGCAKMHQKKAVPSTALSPVS